ncbi:MAG TPA: DUF4337 domain-containing protein [Nitrospiria bacterium]|nr:DUF4337 domain-containing protein [Nitrospiria bacterium]
MSEVELPNPEELKALRAEAFGKHIALVTAAFAAALALAAMGGNHATKEMLLAQQRASDQWAFYQAKSIREHDSLVHQQLLELELSTRGASLTHEARRKMEATASALAGDAQRYHEQKIEIEREAKALEQERDRFRAKDPYFEYAEALLQIAIVMASISIVADSFPVFIVSLVMALTGAFLTLDGYTLLIALPFIGG